jgi:hypothetical protein
MHRLLTRNFAMKKAIKYFLGGFAAALLGAVCLASGRLERDIARAQQDVATEHYDRPDATFETAERFFEYGSRIPGVGNGPLNKMRARRAALRYWQHQYEAIVPQLEDPVAAIPPDNVDLQVIVANAIYRARRAEVKDRASMIEALNSAISAYSTALKNSKRREDAAFNYEYLVRLRDEFEKERRKPDGAEGPEENPFGRAAAPLSRTGDTTKFKVLVPLEPSEPSESGAGKAAPMKRKG